MRRQSAEPAAAVGWRRMWDAAGIEACHILRPE
jgi:hypothetical protein